MPTLRRRRARLLTGLFCAVTILAGALAGAGAAAGSAQAYVFRVSVGSGTPARALPNDFLGLALEYRAVPSLVGPTPAAPDPVFVQLLRNLDPSGHPVLRIGGQSTDRTWWPVPGTNRPLGVTYNLSPAWIASARGLVAATGAKLILGLGLEANRPRDDAVEASQLLAGLGRAAVDALEIGNEPELYSIVPWYLRLRGVVEPWYTTTGQRVFARPSAYGFAPYMSDFGRAVAAVPKGLPLAGPSSGVFGWLHGFERYESRRSPVRVVSWHEYGLNECVTDPRLPSYPSVPNLLKIATSRATIGPIGPEVAHAHRAGEQFRVDEMGSVSCNGRAGVSDTMATALWVMDTLFAIDADGVDGVDLHTQPSLDNGLFDTSRTGTSWTAAVHPIYYGALMFAQAAPPGSRLLPLSTPAQTTMRAWATRAPDGSTRVLLINDSLHRSALGLVHTAGSAPATLERLQARSAYAQSGLSLGGQTFGTATSTGVLAAASPQSVSPRGGHYAVGVPAASAVLLTVPASL